MAAKRARKSATKGDLQPESIASVPEATHETETPAPTPTAGIVDPIGDTTDGEAKVYLGSETPAETATEETPEAKSSTETDSAEDEDADPEFTPKPRPPAKLERLQKILSQAGVASRRKAEEMIEQGRVQVNGTVVTELGTKADAGRDHIRVDGKLLHGAERLRYFVLNKPKGFVTTVKDPEGRPTVMQFFEKMRERLYPVGRLDYMSEGLLLVTNDGDLANRLTKAGSGVEKVYLVKVAGQPTEAELDILRGGVSIERGKPGSSQVRTSPARIRQVRQGDNPWYEVVLIEGRNRELRKMFSAIGHFVEKIRRVGYGPLVLDQEPGNLRELQPEELVALRLAAEGKHRTPKAKEVRRRNLADSHLPTVQPKPSRLRPSKPFAARPPAKPFEPRNFEPGPAASSAPGEFRPKRPFSPSKPFRSDKPFRTARPSAEGFRPAAGPAKYGPAKPAWKKDDRAPRPPARFASGATGEARPPTSKPYGDRPATPRTYGSKPAEGRTFGSKPVGRPFDRKPATGRPAPSKPFSTKSGSDRPPFKRPVAPRREAPAHDEEFPEIRPGGLRIDPVELGHAETYRPESRSKSPARPSAGRPPFDRPRSGKPGFGKPRFDKPKFEKTGPAKPRFEKSSFERSAPPKPRFAKPGFDKPRFEKSSFEKPRFERFGSGTHRSSAGPSRPSRTEGGLARPFTTSSGKPRAGGARPSSKAFKPDAAGHSKPRPGGFSKSGPKGSSFKGKPGAAKRTGPRPGGKKRG
ncbi:MAG TPA: pseudouridine synthase [Terracidiphilus sp.]|nr:pseudouridine synthase [Terracidiphilus sp.]